MKKYLVVGSSKPEFLNIEMNIVFDDITLGKPCKVFGHNFTITQTGKCVTLSSDTWVISLLELAPPKIDKWIKTLDNPKDLRINHEVDLFFKKKVVKLSLTDRLKDKYGVTLLCLYRFLKNEWKYIEPTIKVSFPFEYDVDNKLFIMNEEWDFDSVESIRLIREGSFSRYNSDGRCI